MCNKTVYTGENSIFTHFQNSNNNFNNFETSLKKELVIEDQIKRLN